ncbi:MAG: glycerate kinase [Actinomycetota bacterium]|nr:glycerate kinase [Actinomycetota bacterium]
MRALIAPDKFKGTLSAPAAALAIAEGVREALPSAVISLCPLADGGSGTVDALLDAVDGQKRYVSTTDPWGVPIRAPVAALADGSVCIETAAPEMRDAVAADSGGTGRALIEAAALSPTRTVLVAVGGTASTDGGVGLARALGWRFVDAHGQPLPPGGGALAELARIEAPTERIDANVIGLCDVDTPLLGAAGAARRFGPQKGASPEQVELLERGLTTLARVIERDLDLDVERLPHAGAGGGLAAGLSAFLGAELRSGFGFVAEKLRLERLVSEADVVVTGEGRFDEQSLDGKAPTGLALMARGLGVPCLGIFGSIALAPKVALTAGFSDVVDLTDPREAAPGPQDPFATLARGARALMQRLPA